MKEHVPSKILIAFVWIPFLLWAAALLLGGKTLTAEQFRSYSPYVGVVPILALAFEHFIWRLRPMGLGIVKTPVLFGTWKGSIMPTWVDPKTGKVPDPIEAFLVINQTFSTIQARLVTEQSSSALLSGTLRNDEGGPAQLLGIYRNTPGLRHRSVSAIHFGAISLTIEGRPAKCLRGHYWTDRDTKGEMLFELRDPKSKADSFQSAKNGKYS